MALLRIILHSLLSFLRRGKARAGASGGVLVVFGGVIGDGVLFFDALKAMASLFKSRGKKLVLCCGKEVEAFLRELRRDIDIEIFGCDMDRIISDYGYFKSTVAALNGVSFELLITPMYSKKADIIALNAAAGEKLALRFRIGKKLSFAYLLDSMTYTRRIYTEPGCMALKTYKELLHYLGGTGYATGIVRLKAPESTAGYESHAPYCAVCPVSREPERRWETEKLSKVLDYITGATVLNIYISAADAPGLFDKIKARVKRPERLFDYTGGKSCADWVELIRNARFCFGAETAAIHIAAYTGVRYVAVTSGFNYGYALPYAVDNAAPDDALPVAVCAAMPCFGCYRKNGFRAAGNRLCRRSIKKNGRLLCIEAVTAEMAIAALGPVIERCGGART